MSFFQYLPFLMILAMIIVIISSIIYQKKNLPVKLFIEAQKNENDGHFEEAVISYESALQEARKIRFQRSLESRIIDKLKVLNTAIEYRNNFRFAR